MELSVPVRQQCLKLRLADVEARSGGVGGIAKPAVGERGLALYDHQARANLNKPYP